MLAYSFVLLLYQSPLMEGVFGGILLYYLAVSWFFVQKIYPLKIAGIRAQSAVKGDIADSFQGIQTVESFARYEQETERNRGPLENFIALHKKESWWAMARMLVTGMSMALMIPGVIALGYMWYIQGMIELEVLSFFVVLTPVLMTSFFDMGGNIQEIIQQVGTWKSAIEQERKMRVYLPEGKITQAYEEGLSHDRVCEKSS